MNETTKPAVEVPLDAPVRPLVKRLRDADADYTIAWGTGDLYGEAADAIERLTAALKKANDQAEHFERLWYMAKENADRYAFSKTLEGQAVTMETFKVRGAAELDQALDDAMAEDADARNEAGYAA